MPVQIIYEGADITKCAEITRCVHTDASHGRADCLDIEMENAEQWFRWKPRPDDSMEAVLEGYSTGRMYLSTILPENGKYRILATATPRAARKKSNGAYENMRLADIAAICAAECSMESALYGIGTDIRHTFALRTDESAPKFIGRLMRMEGAVMKAVQGRLCGISIAYAQGLKAARTIQITDRQEQTQYIRRPEKRLRGVTILTPYTRASATDTGAENTQTETYTHYPALTRAEGFRWARGILLCHNREAEELTFQTAFDPAFTAMARIDIDSENDCKGEWIVDTAEHDLKNKTSRVRLYRCIDTIM